MDLLWILLCGLLLLLIASRRAVAYPEIHYRLAPGLSILYRKQPEILFDTPWRINAETPLPVVCLIKDAHLFPITVLGIDVWLNVPEGPHRQVAIHWTEKLPQEIDQPFWWCCGLIDPEEIPHGSVSLTCRMHYRRGRKEYQIITDNLPGLSHDPLRVFIADDPWPTFDGWHYGEIHCHSDKTMDQVEFGAPVAVLAKMADALGLDWVALTDHSYDLDVPPFDHFGLDPEHQRWRLLGQEIKQSDSRCIFIRGQEVSCGNKQNQNVHLLVYEHPEPIPGSGDGGKRGINLDNAPELTLRQVLEQVYPAVTFAAHPDSGGAWLERQLLNRGTWDDSERLLPDGLQIWNCYADSNFHKGLAKWQQSLLQGHKGSILAGSDAHGDFNRTRGVATPFVRLTESSTCFGRPRTCVFVEGQPERDGILKSLKQGCCVLTDGPLAVMTAVTDESTVHIGETLKSRHCQLHVRARSTTEFGPLEEMKLYHGICGQHETEHSFEVHDAYEFEVRYPIDIQASGYLRLEVSSRKAGKIHRCLTNPIWLENE